MQDVSPAFLPDDVTQGVTKRSDTHTPAVLVFYTHHRPRLAHRDLDFFTKAKQRGWICEEFYTQKTGVSLLLLCCLTSTKGRGNTFIPCVHTA